MEQRIIILDRIIVGTLIIFAVFSLFSISVTQIAGGIGGIAWLLKTHWTKSWSRLRWPIGLPFAVFICACLLASIFGADPMGSLKSCKKLLQILIFFWAVNCLTLVRPLEIWDGIFPSVPMGFISRWDAAIRGNLRRLHPQEFFLNLLIVVACLATLYGFYQAISEGVSKLTRVEGTMSVYMTFAGLLMLVGMAALSRLLFYGKSRPGSAVAVGLLGICLLMTLTRQAWLGFGVGLAFLICLRQWRWLLAVPVLAALILAASPASVADRLKSFTNLKDETFLTRTALWSGGWAIFKDYPAIGCGFKCVDTVYPQYPEHRAILERYKGLHSNIVQLAVDAGVLGLGSWLWIWTAFFWSLYRRRAARGKGSSDRWVDLAGAAAVLSFLAGGLFEVNFYDSEVIMLVYFLMAIPFVDPSPNETA